jgi:hypothetical protein
MMDPTMPKPESSQDNPQVQHEESDVNIRAIFRFAAGLTVIAIVVHIAIWGLFRYFDVREARETRVVAPLAVGHEQRQPPEPRLQEAPRADLQQLRMRQEQRLNSYELIDKAAGTVRIPISEAMKLAIQRGLPVRGQGTSTGKPQQSAGDKPK